MMFILSAIQTFFFVLIGNLLLGIRGMLLPYWLVLFTTSCLANILGLNLSSAFNSVITIYILIPFVIIPQLLFSGVLVSFDKLHIPGTKHEYVPVLGDLMPARWSFEALAVHQFSNNKFEKPFFEYNMVKSQNYYYESFLIDALTEDLQRCTRLINNPAKLDSLNGYFTKINYNLDLLSDSSLVKIPQWKSSLNPSSFNAEIESEATESLEKLRKPFVRKKIFAVKQIDSVNAKIENEIGKAGLNKRQSLYENQSLKDLVLNSMVFQDMTYETLDKIIQKYQPGYMKATSRSGRAHFYAPIKNLGNTEIKTYWFNLAVLWIVSLLLYAALYFKLLKRLIDYIGEIKLKKSES